MLRPLFPLARTLALGSALLGCALIGEPLPGKPGQGLVGRGSDRLVGAAGVFDAYVESTSRTDSGRTGAVQLDLRAGRRLFGLGPAAGVMATAGGSVYGFAGAFADFSVGHLMITPLVGYGAYWQNSGKDLGGTFMVRTEIDIAYVRDDGVRIGLRWGHLSNAYIYDENPSQEDFMLTLAFPLLRRGW